MVHLNYGLVLLHMGHWMQIEKEGEWDKYNKWIRAEGFEGGWFLML
jgi:hypothetical protein